MAGTLCFPIPGPRVLADDHLAAITWTDEDASNIELAEQLGLPRARAWETRRRIKQAGHWSCPLI